MKTEYTNRKISSMRRIERWLWSLLAILSLGLLAALLYCCVVAGAMPLWLALPALIVATLLVAASWRMGDTE